MFTPRVMIPMGRMSPMWLMFPSVLTLRRGESLTVTSRRVAAARW